MVTTSAGHYLIDRVRFHLKPALTFLSTRLNDRPLKSLQCGLLYAKEMLPVGMASHKSKCSLSPLTF